MINKPDRSSTNVCVSILFFDEAKVDDKGVITGDGNKPAFNILTDLLPNDYRPCGNNTYASVIKEKNCC